MGSPRPLNKKQVLDHITRGASLADTDMRGQDLAGVKFDGIELARAKLAECNLSRASFRECDLTAASLWHSDCKDAIFDGALLDETDMDFANIDGCTFRSAKVRKAILPNSRQTLAQVLDSVRTGKKVRMSRRSDD